jgi:hypothetical protein
MLLCFGISWPISIAKSFRTKVVAGKSPVFMAIVIAGYGFGIIHKALYSFDWVIYLYALNLVLVAIDMLLYFRYSKRASPPTPLRRNVEGGKSSKREG